MKGIRNSVVAGVWLSVLMALLSIGMIVVLSILVANLGRLSAIPIPDDLSTQVPPDLLSTLRLINGVVLIIPIGIFLLCAYDVGSLIVNPVKALSGKVKSAAVRKQNPFQRRPIIFGMLVFLLSAGVAGLWAYTGIVFQRFAAYVRDTPETTYPISPEELTTYEQIALYSIALPGVCMIFALVQVFKGIQKMRPPADAATADAPDADMDPPAPAESE